MTAELIPVDAIDPAAAHDRWVQQFEWHLDLVPPVMDAIVTMTLPSIQAGRVEKRVTGGGYVDSMTRVLAAFDQSEDAEGIQPGGAAADARHLWGMVVEYVDAAAAWAGDTISAPPPTLSASPDADPLTARRQAFAAIGWLIDNSIRIELFHELEPYREDLFELIRHLRGKYGVVPFSRRPRRVCTTCGERAVVIVWISNPSGSPKPLRAAKCSRCGETWQDTGDDAQRSHTPRRVMSEACDDLVHEGCRAVNCGCSCHSGRRS